MLSGPNGWKKPRLMECDKISKGNIFVEAYILDFYYATKIYNLQENMYINETLLNDGWTEVLFIIKKGYKNNKLKKKKKTNDKKLL